MATKERALTTKAPGHAARAARIVRWKKRFLRSLRSLPNVKVACKAAGIAKNTAYQARKDDLAFASDWQLALDGAIDELEAVAFQKAMDGDPTLLTFLLGRTSRRYTTRRRSTRSAC